MSADDELLALRETFFEEADERISEVEALLLALEQRPDDASLIAPIFRSIHSLKSGGGACELSELAHFAHRFENLLDQIRHGHMRVTPTTLEVLLKSTDALSSLVQKARGLVPQLDEEEVERVSVRIGAELASAGIASAPPAAPVLSNDGIEGLVLWDDEPVAPEPTAGGEHRLRDDPEASPAVQNTTRPSAAPELEQLQRLSDSLSLASIRTCVEDADSSHPAAAGPQRRKAPAQGEAVPTRGQPESNALEEREDAEVELSSEQLSRLIDLSVELVVSSAALAHAVRDPGQLSIERVRDLFTDALTHAGEIENRLAQVRSDARSAISDVVFVRVGENHYFLPLAAVELYFAPEPAALRVLPPLGPILTWRDTALPLYRLRSLIGLPEQQQGTSVALILNVGRRRVALLVDEVLAQTRVVVRPLEAELCVASGLLGAAIYAGAVVLVLDPSALGKRACAGRVQTGTPLGASGRAW